MRSIEEDIKKEKKFRFLSQEENGKINRRIQRQRKWNGFVWKSPFFRLPSQSFKGYGMSSNMTSEEMKEAEIKMGEWTMVLYMLQYTIKIWKLTKYLFYIGIASLAIQVANAQTKYLRVDYRGGTIHVDSIGIPKQKMFGSKDLSKKKLSPVETIKYFEDKGWKLKQIEDRPGNLSIIAFWFIKDEES